MKHRFIIVVFISCCFLQTNLFANKIKPGVLSLPDAILLALRYSPNVESSKLQRVVDKFNVAVAQNQFEFQYGLNGAIASSQTVSNGSPLQTSKNANLIPTISRQTVFGTKYNLAMTNPVSYNAPIPGQYFYNPGLALVVTHPLLQGSGRTITEANLNIALINNEVAKLNLKNAIINQVTQVIIDYRAVVGAENALIVDQNALKAAKDTVKNNEANIRLGFMAPSENTQAKAAVASQQLQIETDLNAIIQAKLLLFSNIGIPYDSKVEVDKAISIVGASYPKGELANELLFANNISYLSALLGLKTAKLSLLLAEDQQRWSLNLTGTITQGGGSGGGENAGLESLFNGSNKGQALGLALSVPIDNMSAQQQVVQSKVSYSQQGLAIQQLKLNLGLQLQGALQNLAVLFAQIGISDNLVKLSNQSYLDALKKSRFGQASMFEVTTLQTSLVTAQLGLIQNEINYLNGIANYEQTLGTTLDVWKIKLVY